MQAALAELQLKLDRMRRFAERKGIRREMEGAIEDAGLNEIVESYLESGAEPHPRGGAEGAESQQSGQRGFQALKHVYKRLYGDFFKRAARLEQVKKHVA